MKQEVNFEMVTPEMAIKWLENNSHNRPINQKIVAQICMDIERDNFHTTGESIKISETGKLLDGQHRLYAIIKTGKSLNLLVIRGLSDTSFKYIDTGKSRTAGDVLAIEKIANAQKIAAIVKFVVNFQKSSYWAATNNSTSRKNNFFTNADVSAFVAKNSHALQESFPYGFNKHNKLLPGTILSSLHFIFNKIDPAKADEFCHRISEGHDLTKSSPIYVLRERLTSDIRTRRKVSRLEQVALICKSWNAYRQNKTFTILKWDSIKEPFPKPL